MSKSPAPLDLTSQFGLSENRLTFEESSKFGGLTVATLTIPSSPCTATISLLGAHVLSLRVKTNTDLLYMSSTSKFSPGIPIRGGIPLILGWFGKREGSPSHGFGRLLEWRPVSSAIENDGSISLTLELNDQELKHSTQFRDDPIWSKRDFIATMKFSLSVGGLTQTLSIENSGSEKIELQGGFHPYFKISDYRSIAVSGLESLTGIDCFKNRAEFGPLRAPLSIVGPTDTIFKSSENLPTTTTINDTSLARAISISQRNLTNWVVWNPGDDFKKTPSWAADIDSNKEFICVEPMIAVGMISIESGKRFEFGMSVSDA